jgi:hypothetical protein
MSLREEIIKIIESHLQGNETGIDGQEEAADEILTLFDKRIDSISKPYMQYYSVPDLINEIKEMLK